MDVGEGKYVEVGELRHGTIGGKQEDAWHSSHGIKLKQQNECSQYYWNIS